MYNLPPAFPASRLSLDRPAHFNESFQASLTSTLDARQSASIRLFLLHWCCIYGPAISLSLTHKQRSVRSASETCSSSHNRPFLKDFDHCTKASSSPLPIHPSRSLRPLRLIRRWCTIHRRRAIHSRRVRRCMPSAVTLVRFDAVLHACPHLCGFASARAGVE